jgi:hypothetical protein
MTKGCDDFDVDYLQLKAIVETLPPDVLAPDVLATDVVNAMFAKIVNKRNIDDVPKDDPELLLVVCLEEYMKQCFPDTMDKYVGKCGKERLE